MSKKIITIIIAAAMIASSAINAFAVGNTSNNSFNVSAQTYTTMSATDKEKFINDNYYVRSTWNWKRNSSRITSRKT